jgi:ABC-2 type transport system permease protein
VLTGRQAARSGATFGAVFGGYVAVQALAYAASYPTLASRRALAKEFGSNAGISALVGPAHMIDTVGGYTTWKCLTVLAIVGSVWGSLSATRWLRGEEDAGRWELLLAGPTTARRAALDALAGLAVGLLTMYAVTWAVIAAAGRSSKVGFGASSSAFLALATISGAVMFVAVGALMSQLCATRRQAAGYSAGILASSYAVRMLADSQGGLDWLRWVTPLGWIEELQPLHDPRPLALVPIGAFATVLAIAAVVVAGRRDVGASLLHERSRSQPHLTLLGGPVGLTIRLLRGLLVGWAVGIVAYGLLLGAIAKSAGTAITSSPSLRAAFGRLGVSGPEAYVGIALLVMAMLLGFVAIGQVAAMRTEESSGRLESLLVHPISRMGWLGRRVVVAAGVVVVGATLGGAAIWIGAEAGGAGIDAGTLMSAAVNTIAPAALLVGLGVLVFGVAPRVTVAVTYSYLVWSLLVELLGGIEHVSHWLLDSSALHQMAAAPAVPIDWVSFVAMVVLGVALGLLGAISFRWRDLAGA